MEEFSIFSLGDQAVTISFGNSISQQQNARVIALKEWIDDHRFTGLLDLIVAYSSLTIVYDLFQVKTVTSATAFEFVKSYVERGLKQLPVNIPRRRKRVRIPVCYDEEFALDIISICDERKLTREEVVEIHVSRPYTVYMIGFLPGFAYMAHVDERIAVPRKQQPRPNVVAGSVGIAGIQTGVYPLNSPGGWQIIGRTPVQMFDAKKEVPTTIEAGDEVQFYAVSRKEFDQML